MQMFSILKQATRYRPILLPQTRRASTNTTVPPHHPIPSRNPQVTTTSTMASQGAVPTANSAAHGHPAVAPSQGSTAQSATARAAEPSPGPTTATTTEQQQGDVSSSSSRSSDPQPPLPPLPAPESEGGAPTTIEVNGARVSLADQLGPAIVNADGTISRIANWAEMTEIERRNTVRILGRRNKLRLEALREGQEAEKQGSGS